MSSIREDLRRVVVVVGGAAASFVVLVSVVIGTGTVANDLFLLGLK